MIFNTVVQRYAVPTLLEAKVPVTEEIIAVKDADFLKGLKGKSGAKKLSKLAPVLVVNAMAEKVKFPGLSNLVDILMDFEMKLHKNTSSWAKAYDRSFQEKTAPSTIIFSMPKPMQSELITEGKEWNSLHKAFETKVAAWAQENLAELHAYFLEHQDRQGVSLKKLSKFTPGFSK